jgi:hypothetical protein
MEVSDLLTAQTSLLPGEKAPIPLGKNAWWILKLTGRISEAVQKIFAPSGI